MDWSRGYSKRLPMDVQERAVMCPRQVTAASGGEQRSARLLLQGEALTDACAGKHVVYIYRTRNKLRGMLRLPCSLRASRQSALSIGASEAISAVRRFTLRVFISTRCRVPKSKSRRSAVPEPRVDETLDATGGPPTIALDGRALTNMIQARSPGAALPSGEGPTCALQSVAAHAISVRRPVRAGQSARGCSSAQRTVL